MLLFDGFSKSGPYMRLGFTYVFLFTAFLLLKTIFLSAQVSRAAHQSYPLINSISVKHKNKLSIRDTFKVMSFIEKLSGPVIGFYCYQLFPMNSYEFYEYVVNAIKMYLLIIEFL